MKIEHSRFDPRSGLYFIVLAGPGQEHVDTATELRCGAYRFQVDELVERYPEASPPASSWLVSGRNPPVEQMVVHDVEEPLTDEESAQAVQHLLMVPRLLMGIDCEGVAYLLNRTLPMLVDGPAKDSAQLLLRLASSLADVTAALPDLAPVSNVERYKSEVLSVVSAAKLGLARP